jgi:hypothetical protein
MVTSAPRKTVREFAACGRYPNAHECGFIATARLGAALAVQKMICYKCADHGRSRHVRCAQHECAD